MYRYQRYLLDMALDVSRIVNFAPLVAIIRPGTDHIYTCNMVQLCVGKAMTQLFDQ